MKEGAILSSRKKLEAGERLKQGAEELGFQAEYVRTGECSLGGLQVALGGSTAVRSAFLPSWVCSICRFVNGVNYSTL